MSSKVESFANDPKKIGGGFAFSQVLCLTSGNDTKPTRKKDEMNKLLLLGTVGRDVEIKSLSPTNRMAKFSVAINADWKDSNGAWQKKTEWVNVVAWGNLADRCHELLTKGSKVFIEGEIETKSYEKNGQKVYATHCKALKIQPITYMKKSDTPKEDDLDQFLQGNRSGESLLNEDIPF